MEILCKFVLTLGIRPVRQGIIFSLHKKQIKHKNDTAHNRTTKTST